MMNVNHKSMEVYEMNEKCKHEKERETEEYANTKACTWHTRNNPIMTILLSIQQLCTI